MGEHDVNKSCDNSFKRLEDAISNLANSAKDESKTLVKVQESSKSAHLRIKDLKDETNDKFEKVVEDIEGLKEEWKVITRLAISVEDIAKQNEKILTELHLQRKDMNDMKNKPALEIYGYWKMFIGAIVVAAAGVVAGVLFTKGGL